KREIASREDVIKIHSLVHHQLSAPVFSSAMIKYAWFASGLDNDRKVFQNVKQVCFPLEAVKNKCMQCKNTNSFIRCSKCNLFLCFPCFYDKYHPICCN